VRWSETAIFGDFGYHIFGALTLEANSIMHRQEVRFPVTSKCVTLNDFEMPFYAKICFHRRYD